MKLVLGTRSYAETSSLENPTHTHRHREKQQTNKAPTRQIAGSRHCLAKLPPAPAPSECEELSAEVSLCGGEVQTFSHERSRSYSVQTTVLVTKPCCANSSSLSTSPLNPSHTHTPPTCLQGPELNDNERPCFAMGVCASPGVRLI